MENPSEIKASALMVLGTSSHAGKTAVAAGLCRLAARSEAVVLKGAGSPAEINLADGGFEVPSGQYFYRFTAGRYVKTRKMILVK